MESTNSPLGTYTAQTANPDLSNATLTASSAGNTLETTVAFVRDGTNTNPAFTNTPATND